MTKTDGELPCVRAADLAPQPAEGHWLIDRIWGRDGVGIIGGAPKCAKSWFGLDMAISIASETSCLGTFPVTFRGPTLVYLAEDALPQVRERIAGICAHRKLDIESLDLQVITAPVLRLDDASDQMRLAASVARIQPRLLLLDPLVRLHRLDENSSADISSLLGYLRELSRRANVAIAVVHHMSKRVRAQLGQALRGSGDLHAWGDHNAYLTRHGAALRLTLEHRSAQADEPYDLRLLSRADGSATHLEITKPVEGSSSVGGGASLAELVMAALRRAGRAISRSELREILRVNNNRLGDVLNALEGDGHIRRSDAGIALRS